MLLYLVVRRKTDTQGGGLFVVVILSCLSWRLFTVGVKIGGADESAVLCDRMKSQITVCVGRDGRRMDKARS